MTDVNGSISWNIRPRAIVFYVGLIISICTVIGIGYKTGSFAVGLMHESAADLFDDRLEPTLKPPDGKTYLVITSAVKDHAIAADAKHHSEAEKFSIEVNKINLRLQRQEIMMDSIYTEITGRQPPPVAIPGS